MLIVLVFGKTKEEWRNRTIYQLLTDRFASSVSNSSSCDLGNYCGGNFKGIQNNLDYIQSKCVFNTLDLGFDAIWISPIV